MKRRGIILPVAIILGAAACDGPCTMPPCPEALVAELTVTSATPGASLTAAFYSVSGPTRADSVACGSGTTMTCIVGGPPGTYVFDVGAPRWR